MLVGLRKPFLDAICVGTTATLFLFGTVAAQAQNVLFASGSSTNNIPGSSLNNLAFGYNALNNPTGGGNNAIGSYALANNTTGGGNNAHGYSALAFNTTGYHNSAYGDWALYSNTTGSYNSSMGGNSLYSNDTGQYNSAFGYNALYSNQSGDYNTATGLNALGLNTVGYANVASGNNALFNNVTGYFNTAVGGLSLANNTTGNNNTVCGGYALFNLSTGSNNVAIGYRAGINATVNSNCIFIDNEGYDTDRELIRIGTPGVHNTVAIAGISGVNIGSGDSVYVSSNGQLGIITSSRRFKRDIKTMGSVSDRLMRLRPVTFRYKQAVADGSHPLQYGLIAEEVAKVYPDLVHYDKQGKPFAIYYHLLTPMILNELQNEHRQNVALQTALAAQNTKIAAMEVAHKAEIAELKQSLAKLAAYVESTQNHAPVQKATYIQH